MTLAQVLASLTASLCRLVPTVERATPFVAHAPDDARDVRELAAQGMARRMDCVPIGDASPAPCSSVGAPTVWSCEAEVRVGYPLGWARGRAGCPSAAVADAALIVGALYNPETWASYAGGIDAPGTARIDQIQGERDVVAICLAVPCTVTWEV